ncbi:unnamed protein product [Toxocara canis]|uniref:PUM-HD domain-containing protein n=1 Tax=Toxocara canis TaxID=6265 RepID=A0A183UPW5_TOXCA|nr:unnamed protein product [Toxocara canis]
MRGVPLSIAVIEEMIKHNPLEAKRSLESWIDSGYVELMAKKEIGSKFLQSIIPVPDERLRKKICRAVFHSDVFYSLCSDAHGSQFVQKLVEQCDSDDIAGVLPLVRGYFVVLSCGNYSTHAMQRLWDKFDDVMRMHLLGELRGMEADLAIDRCGTYLISKVIESMGVFGYGPIVDSIASSSVRLHTVAENVYGSRVVQVALHKLEVESYRCDSRVAQALLNKLLIGIIEDCEHFACHRFANYIIQQIISSSLPGEHSTAVIKTFLGKLLRLSQEKYASHVLEKALDFGSAEMLYWMMEEILDGYECDNEGWDAVGVMLMDRFGNYVVQKMLDVVVAVRLGRREGSAQWYDRLAVCIIRRRDDLQKYSSGKKILAKLEAVSLCRV